jgi:hypothetical protein
MQCRCMRCFPWGRQRIQRRRPSKYTISCSLELHCQRTFEWLSSGSFINNLFGNEEVIDVVMEGRGSVLQDDLVTGHKVVETQLTPWYNSWRDAWTNLCLSSLSFSAPLQFNSAVLVLDYVHSTGIHTESKNVSIISFCWFAEFAERDLRNATSRLFCSVTLVNVSCLFTPAYDNHWS